MESVLVSSCLLGQAVRYDGSDKLCRHAVLQRWIDEGRVLAVCPEIAGGLPIPRPAAEIVGGVGGLEVLAGMAKVVDSAAQNVSMEFIKGAEYALARAKSKGIRIAVLKEGSPSCGSNYIYDGTFTANTIGGLGVTAALLEKAGIQVFSEAELEKADALLKQLEMTLCTALPVFPS